MSTNAEIHWTAKMRLIDLLLKQNAQISLRRFIIKERRGSATRHPANWDDIAHQVRLITGERVVRETMISYARTFGLAPERIPTATDAEQAEQAEAAELAEGMAVPAHVKVA